MSSPHAVQREAVHRRCGTSFRDASRRERGPGSAKQHSVLHRARDDMVAFARDVPHRPRRLLRMKAAAGDRLGCNFFAIGCSLPQAASLEPRATLEFRRAAGEKRFKLASSGAEVPR